MNKPHAHIYSAKINKWIAGTLKLPTYLRPRSPHGAKHSRDSYSTGTRRCMAMHKQQWHSATQQMITVKVDPLFTHHLFSGAL